MVQSRSMRALGRAAEKAAAFGQLGKDFNCSTSRSS